MAVTRNDVARAASVSVAVVSYVVNGGPRPVSAAARARVLKAIDDLGYRPDSVARYLRTGSTRSIGLVLPDISLSYFAEMTQRLSSVSDSRGYQLLVSTSMWSSRSEHERVGELLARRADGIILMSADPQREVSAWESASVPIVVVDRSQRAVNSARALTAHLLEVHGRTRIGTIEGEGRGVPPSRRAMGWRRAMEDAQVPVDERLVRASALTRAGGYAAAGALLDAADRPDALVIDGLAQAEGALRAALERGIDVPRDLSVVTFEGLGGIAALSIPSLTTADSPYGELASECIELILDGGHRGVVRLDKDDFTLHFRESCGCLTG